MPSLAQLLSNSCRQCLSSFRLASPTACRGQMRTKVYKSYATPVSESNTAASKNLTADLIIYTQNSSWRAIRPVLGAVGWSVFCANAAYGFYLVRTLLIRKKQNNPAGSSADIEYKGWYDPNRFLNGTLHQAFMYVCIVFGAVSAIGGVIIPFRVIKSIVLMRNGKEVAITTHAALLRNKTVHIPISKVESRITPNLERTMLIQLDGIKLPFIMQQCGQKLNRGHLKTVIQKGTNSVS